MLYCIFLYMDFFKIQHIISTNVIKFICIIMCFIISTLTRNNAIHKRDLYLLQIGLFATIMADYFLLMLNGYYIWGIGLFCVVQITYSLRYNIGDSRLLIMKFIIIFLIILLAYIFINNFIMKVEFLFVLALFYAICLWVSLIKSIEAYRYKKYPNPSRWMIVLGMLLFLLCDINVALYNIIGIIFPSDGYLNLLYNVSSISMWLFYLPSQVLLSLS